MEVVADELPVEPLDEPVPAAAQVEAAPAAPEPVATEVPAEEPQVAPSEEPPAIAAVEVAMDATAVPNTAVAVIETTATAVIEGGDAGAGSEEKPAKVPRLSRQGKTVPRWTLEEEELLKTAVAEVGDRNWQAVADKLANTRSAMAVEQHWCVRGGRYSPHAHAGRWCLPVAARIPLVAQGTDSWSPLACAQANHARQAQEAPVSQAAQGEPDRLACAGWRRRRSLALRSSHGGVRGRNHEHSRRGRRDADGRGGRGGGHRRERGHRRGPDGRGRHAGGQQPGCVG